MKLNGLNDQLMATAAHRYCLGRMSYIVSSCQEWIGRTWVEFESNTRIVMLRDTLEAIPDNNLGMEMDKRGWVETAILMYNFMTPEEREKTLEQIRWKGITDIPEFLEKQK